MTLQTVKGCSRGEQNRRSNATQQRIKRKSRKKQGVTSKATMSSDTDRVGDSSLSDNSSDLDEDKFGADDSSDNVIAKGETKAVWRLKLAVLFVLAASAAGVAATAYLYLSQSEESQFRKQYDEDLSKILEAIGSSLDKTFGLMDSIAVTWVSTARMTNQTWPFVSVPDFAVRMAKVLPQTDLVNINIIPIVTPEKRSAWEAYATDHLSWLNNSVRVQSDWAGYHGPTTYDWELIEKVSGDFGPIPDNVTRIMLPIWQNFPVIPTSSWKYNYDWNDASVAQSYRLCLKNHVITMTKPYMLPTGDPIVEAETKIWAENFRAFIGPDEESLEPMADVTYPIVDEIDSITVAGEDGYNPSNHNVVGLIGAPMYFRSLIQELLPQGSDGIHVVFDNSCASPFTYEIDGPVSKYLGVGDLHQKAYDDMGHDTKLYDLAGSQKTALYTGARADRDFCPMTLRIYPSDVMKASFTSKNPKIFTVAVIFIFAFTTLVFFLYDAMVERRQKKVMRTAVRSSAIVSSLFPSSVRDRLDPEAQKAKLDALVPETAQRKLQSFLRASKNSSDMSCQKTSFSGAPIAELYSETTVLFADIAGFTSWSSTRQPSQVFTLLETVYAGFDSIARQRGVFKVETIGDCYVAVVGLPTPRRRHAVVAAKFANDCRSNFRQVTAELEKALGPGTAELALRCGLNSGPTTAGVLRGEKSRFQLFGDTVNTAARMESSGETNKIHVSQKTAELIKAAGKGHWLTIREDQVDCKGKGLLTSYWCEPTVEGTDADTRSTGLSRADSELDSVEDVEDSKLERLINWNVGMFSSLLKEIVKHQGRRAKSKSKDKFDPAETTSHLFQGNPINEVAEVLTFPESSRSRAVATTIDPKKTVDIDPSIFLQLHGLISAIATLYRNNPFHNFEHCCHVAMSTRKLLFRIAEGGKELAKEPGHEPSMTSTLADSITDPLAQFALIFAALIHDVDHPGISNAQMVQEQHALAATYQNRSVAEQNSIDIGWNLLMASPQNADLRACLFACEADVRRFRQIVLNAVMATDLFDKELKSMRESRWTKSFASGNMSIVAAAGGGGASLGNTDCHRRATIIIDLIIQASDVSHTMQHFTVYKKWNMNLLTEMYDAYTSGRTSKDPLDGWYEGELWFFDNYIIPLAQKLRECGVFGVSCDEFLDYAQDNRLEWETKGRSIVEQAKEVLLQRITSKSTLQ